MRITAACSSFLYALIVLILTTSLPVHAADCSGLPGTREATANDAAVKNGQITAGTCYNPSDSAIGEKQEAAKAYLKSLPRVGSATDDTNIMKLDQAFAQCSAKFLKDFTQKNGNITIRSAFRSSQYDAAMCRNNPNCGALMNNPNPMGNHQRGLAMDIAADAGQPALWNFSRSNPQYGVCFPFTGETGGFKDTVHMILVGGPGSEASGPGCRGVTKACDGSNFNPNAVPYSPSSPSSPAPQIASTGMNNYCMTSIDPIIVVPISGAPGPNCYNYQQQQQPPPLPPPMQQAQQPLQYTPQQTSTGSTGSNGASGAAATQPSISNLVSTPFGSTAVATTSAYAQLLNIVNYVPSSTPQTKTSTTSPLQLIDSLIHYGSIQGSLPDDSPEPVTSVATNTIAINYPSASQETFTSDDLRNNPSKTAIRATAAPTGSLLSMLSNLRSILLNILRSLQPSHRSAPAPLEEY